VDEDACVVWLACVAEGFVPGDHLPLWERGSFVSWDVAFVCSRLAFGALRNFGK